MSSSFSAWVIGFTIFGFLGAIAVIAGVVFESAEMLSKLGREKKYRRKILSWLRWIEGVFGEERRRKLISVLKYIEERSDPFEMAGFILMVGGLSVELLGSGTAEILQFKENSEQATKIEVLRKQNDELEIRLQPRRITPTQQGAFIEFLKNTPKGAVRMVVRDLPWETQDFADDIYDALIAAGFTVPEKIERNENILPVFVKPGFDLEIIMKKGLFLPISLLRLSKEYL